MNELQKSQSLPVVVLSIAGSDNSGGAGIQADLKTFTTCGVYGTTAVTSVVAESPGKVLNITPIPPERVVDQIRLVFESFPVAGMKTGLLASAEIIEAIEAALEETLSRGVPLVVDPVMVATSGKVLLPGDAIAALRKLIRRATVITPNKDEAELLWGDAITDLASLEKAARELVLMFGGPAVLAKGGHLKTDMATDVLALPSGVVEILEVPRIKNVDPHGTGCTYSAAITAMLARGHSLVEAVKLGKQFITRAIQNRVEIGGYPLLNHLPYAHRDIL
jgi:hydroxymethylpyrimidine/phosphomethylpyrimidine kinase